MLLLRFLSFKKLLVIIETHERQTPQTRVGFSALLFTWKFIVDELAKNRENAFNGATESGVAVFEFVVNLICIAFNEFARQFVGSCGGPYFAVPTMKTLISGSPIRRASSPMFTASCGVSPGGSSSAMCCNSDVLGALSLALRWAMLICQRFKQWQANFESAAKDVRLVRDVPPLNWR